MLLVFPWLRKRTSGGRFVHRRTVDAAAEAGLTGVMSGLVRGH